MTVQTILSPTQKQKLIAEFKTSMQDLYGDRLSRVILYGSYARGDARPDSDIDFLVVLRDGQISTGREIDCITDQVFGLILRYGLDISFLPMSLSRFQEANNPLLDFVKKEGIEA